MKYKRKNTKRSKIMGQKEACKMEDYGESPLSCHQHPLLFPEVLDIIFKYMDSDYYSLRSCREVCRVWNVEACKVLKNCNSPALLTTSTDLQAFYDDLKSPNGQTDIVKGIVFQGLKIQNDDYKQLAFNPVTPLLWNCLKKSVGKHLTLLDISLVTLQKTDFGRVEPRRLRLSDLRKLVFVMCPNLSHLVLREVQKQFLQKKKSNGVFQCQSKLKSLVLKNEIPNEWYARQMSISVKTNHVQRNYDPWLEFYNDLLLNCPDLKHVGYFFHLFTSSKVYLDALTSHIDQGRLTKLESIERVSHGRTGTGESGAHIDIGSTRDLVANFKSIHLRSNLVFVPAQLSTSFRSSWNSVEDMNLSAYYYNEANYLTAVIQFDENKIPIPYMENLKKLCLRGGIPLEPFLLNAPNLEELVISFMGSKNCEDEKLPPIKFWNDTWRDVRLTPLYNLRKLDIGHCAFICPHDIQTIAKLCPSIKTFAVPFQSNGCIPSVFKNLSMIEELDIVLLDDVSHLTDDILIGVGSSNPGIAALQELQVFRIRVNEISKLSDAVRKHLPITYLDIAKCCLLTDEFISFIGDGAPNLTALQLEAGQFTDSAWNSLGYDKLPSLRYLEVPDTCTMSP